MSWGFHFLTNELRRHEKIQGYIYTELIDIEWEHNGFYDYDRSAKEFGYDAFVPGMTTRDLQGEDFVGYDDPPMMKPPAFSLPVFVSHFSARTDAADAALVADRDRRFRRAGDDASADAASEVGTLARDEPDSS